eukprot:16340322-Heterocapsa_arctica.AAC.1
MIKGFTKWGGLVAGNRTDSPTLSPKRSNDEEIVDPRRVLTITDSSERYLIQLADTALWSAE